MMILVLAQAAVSLPDIQIGVRLTAERVTIEKKGDARLTVTSSPEGRNIVDVRAPKADGSKTLRNVSVEVDAEARVADKDIRSGPETVATSPR